MVPSVSNPCSAICMTQIIISLELLLIYFFLLKFFPEHHFYNSIFATSLSLLVQSEQPMDTCWMSVWMSFSFSATQWICCSKWFLEFHLGFSGGSDGKESTCNVGDLCSIPGLGRSPGGGHGNPLQYSCLENPHWQRILAGYSPWGCKESDMTEQLSTQSSTIYTLS